MFKAYFLSDIHLSSGEDTRAQLLLGFLSGLKPKEDITHLFLMGDIFDLWISDYKYFIGKYKSIIDELLRLKNEGVEIHYFEGNHDLYLKKYWQKKIGFIVHEGAEYFDLENTKIRVEHGDQIDPDDKGYIFLRWLLRTPIMKLLVSLMPEIVMRKIGEGSSKQSRNYTSKVKTIHNEQAIEKIRAHAKKSYVQAPFDYIFSGHLHIRDEFKFEKAVSVNLGSWLDKPCVVKLSKEGYEILEV